MEAWPRAQTTIVTMNYGAPAVLTRYMAPSRHGSLLIDTTPRNCLSYAQEHMVYQSSDCTIVMLL